MHYYLNCNEQCKTQVEDRVDIDMHECVVEHGDFRDLVLNGIHDEEKPGWQNLEEYTLPSMRWSLVGHFDVRDDDNIAEDYHPHYPEGARVPFLSNRIALQRKLY